MGRKKPVGKSRMLFNVSAQRGWGEIDESLVQDYGSSNWEPDPEFQRRSGQHDLSTKSERSPTTQQCPHTSRRNFPRGREACTLIFDVPSNLEYICQRECYALWPRCAPVMSQGRIETNLKGYEEYYRVFELKSLLAARVMVFDDPTFFSNQKSMAALLGKVRLEAKHMSWITPLQIWAECSDKGSVYDPTKQLDTWFPFPSYRIDCVTPSGEKIVNYDDISHAFMQGFRLRFPKWQCNSSFPDFVILMQIQSPHLKILIELKPINIANPFIDGTPRLSDQAIAHTMLQLVHVKPGDVLLNCFCSKLDIMEEVLKEYPDVIQCIASDLNCQLVSQSIKISGSWSELRQAEGMISDHQSLPFHDSSIDIVVSILRDNVSNRMLNKTVLVRYLQEMARVCRTRTGRVCFLTTSECDLIDSLLNKRGSWSAVNKHCTNLGTFGCTLYVLWRSELPLVATALIEGPSPCPPATLPGRARRIRHNQSSRTEGGVPVADPVDGRNLTPWSDPSGSSLMDSEMEWE